MPAVLSRLWITCIANIPIDGQNSLEQIENAKQGVLIMRICKDEEAATDRAILVLVRESKRAQEGAERVRLVLDALALRRGVIRERRGAEAD